MFAHGENVIVDYPFSGEALTGGKRILLGAHHNKFHKSPGANDNASGVAVLLELLAKLQREKPSGKFLRAVFFALEDSGGTIMAGSRRYVKQYGTDDLDRMYNVDTVGMGDILLLFPATKDSLEQAWLRPLAKAAHLAGLPLEPRKFLGWPFFTLVLS